MKRQLFSNTEDSTETDDANDQEETVSNLKTKFSSLSLEKRRSRLPESWSVRFIMRELELLLC